MPLAKPHKGESKTTFIQRCYGDKNTRAEFKDDNNQIGGYCYSTWKDHSAKASLIVSAGDNEYPVDMSQELGPIYPPKHHDMVFESGADNSDPINDSGPNSPVSPNKAPPAAPFPAKTAPTSDMPSDDDENLGPGTQDEDYDEYVGGREINPAPLPNPEGGALAPNPDNDTQTPQRNQNPNTFYQGKKPNLDDCVWFLGKKMTFEVDTQTGLAKWPLTFQQIEKDFHRPNKPRDWSAEPQHTDNEDAEKVAQQEKPFETGTPI